MNKVIVPVEDLITSETMALQLAKDVTTANGGGVHCIGLYEHMSYYHGSVEPRHVTQTIRYVSIKT